MRSRLPYEPSGKESFLSNPPHLLNRWKPGINQILHCLSTRHVSANQENARDTCSRVDVHGILMRFVSYRFDSPHSQNQPPNSHRLIHFYQTHALIMLGWPRIMFVALLSLGRCPEIHAWAVPSRGECCETVFSRSPQ